MRSLVVISRSRLPTSARPVVLDSPLRSRASCTRERERCREPSPPTTSAQRCARSLECERHSTNARFSGPILCRRYGCRQNGAETNDRTGGGCLALAGSRCIPRSPAPSQYVLPGRGPAEAAPCGSAGPRRTGWDPVAGKELGRTGGPVPPSAAGFHTGNLGGLEPIRAEPRRSCS